MRTKTGLAWLPAAVWAYLAVGRGRWWSARSELPGPERRDGPQVRDGRDRRQGRDASTVGDGPDGPQHPQKAWPAVAVVVPARDETELLPLTLPSLLAQDYLGPLQVVVVDDRSTDATAEVAVAHRGKSQHSLSVVRGAPLPEGWVGKPWAMAQGAEVASRSEPSPEWVLFTDADIWHPLNGVAQLVQAAGAGSCQALSVMAHLRAQGNWERLLMPAFVYFFAQIYPFSKVNRGRLAAAAGGCCLVHAAALKAAGGVGAIKGEVIDDVALAKALHRQGARLWLTLAGDGADGHAPDVRSLRRYPRLRDVWAMVARSAYTQLHHNPVALGGTVAGLSVLYLAPVALVGVGLWRRRPRTAAPGLVAWTLMSATYTPMTTYYGLSPVAAAALPFTAGLYMAMTVTSAWQHYRRRARGPQAGDGPGRAKLDGWR